LSGAEAEILVDARGLRCPWPVLRLARTMRERAGPVRVRVRADDPAAPGEIAALAAEQGWRLEPSESSDSVLITRT
jgi:tRNA 2-thiouridine synthesizing protein A